MDTKSGENKLNKLQNAIQKYKGQYPVPIIEIAADLGIKTCRTSTFKNSESGSIAYKDAHEVAHYILHKDRLMQTPEHIDFVKSPLSKTNRLNRKNCYATDEEGKIEAEANEHVENNEFREEDCQLIWDNLKKVVRNNKCKLLKYVTAKKALELLREV